MHCKEHGLAQLDIPVCVIEERFPRAVFIVAQADRDERVALGPYGHLDKPHTGLLGRSSTFSRVAADASADEVFPRVLAAVGARLDVIDGEVVGGEVTATVLTEVAIAGEEVTSIELDDLVGEAFVPKQPDDSGHGDIYARRADPVKALGLELSLQHREFGPGCEVVIEECAIDRAVVSDAVNVDYFGVVSREQAKGSTSRDNPHGNICLVEHEDFGTE